MAFLIMAINSIGVDDLTKQFDYDTVAKYLYDAGYRKADDVKRETAKEILSDIYFNLKISAKEEPKSNDYYNVLGWIEEIAKEYGVEVEELE